MKSRYLPRDAARLFGELDAPWWVAGGWAIDLWLGTETREHADLDIAVLRDDQLVFWQLLPGWDLRVVTGPGVLEAWSQPGVVPLPHHAVWCRPTPGSDWAFEILLNDSRDGRWLFRRDHSVRLPLTELGGRRDGTPYLVPEVVLLFKAKNVRRHDTLDFHRSAGRLDEDARSWLVNAIEKVHPGHPWLSFLRETHVVDGT